MSLSVHVERVSEIPGGRRVLLDADPEGDSTLYLLEGEISAEYADLIGDVLTHAKRGVYYPLIEQARAGAAAG